MYFVQVKYFLQVFLLFTFYRNFLIWAPYKHSINATNIHLNHLIFLPEAEMYIYSSYIHILHIELTYIILVIIL